MRRTPASVRVCFLSVRDSSRVNKSPPVQYSMTMYRFWGCAAVSHLFNPPPSPGDVGNKCFTLEFTGNDGYATNNNKAFNEANRSKDPITNRTIHMELYTTTPHGSNTRFYCNPDLSPEQLATKFAGRMLHKTIMAHIPPALFPKLRAEHSIAMVYLDGKTLIQAVAVSPNVFELRKWDDVIDTHSLPYSNIKSTFLSSVGPRVIAGWSDR